MHRAHVTGCGGGLLDRRGRFLRAQCCDGKTEQEQSDTHILILRSLVVRSPIAVPEAEVAAIAKAGEPARQYSHGHAKKLQH